MFSSFGHDAKRSTEGVEKKLHIIKNVKSDRRDLVITAEVEMQMHAEGVGCLSGSTNRRKIASANSVKRILLVLCLDNVPDASSLGFGFGDIAIPNSRRLKSEH